MIPPDNCGCGAPTTNAAGKPPGRANPLRLDPTRTTTLRRQLLAEMHNRFRALKGDIYRLVVTDDAFGIAADKAAGARGAQPGGLAAHLAQNAASGDAGGSMVANTRWRFETDAAKLDKYREWLKNRVEAGILEVSPGNVSRPWLEPYIQSSYKRGVVRAYTDTNAARLAAAAEDLSFVAGGKEQFLKDAFGGPMAQGKIQQLSTRAFSQLEGVTATMDQEMTRVLSDGLTRGAGAREVARELNQTVDKMEKTRARTIARTELIHTHAEGQLDSFEAMGVEGLDIMAEWNTAHDDKVCPLCQPLEGVILTPQEARGMIPRHPNCRCAWVPAGVGEDQDHGTTKTTHAGEGQGLSPPGTKPTGKTTGQQWSNDTAAQRISQSIKAEHPKLATKDAKAASKWVGADHTKGSISGKLKPGSKQWKAVQQTAAKAKAQEQAQRVLAAKTAQRRAAKAHSTEVREGMAKAKWGLEDADIYRGGDGKSAVSGGWLNKYGDSKLGGPVPGGKFPKEVNKLAQAKALGEPTKPYLVHQLEAADELLAAKVAAKAKAEAEAAAKAARVAKAKAAQADALAAQVAAAKAKFNVPDDMVVGAASPKPSLMPGEVGLGKMSKWAEANHGVKLDTEDFQAFSEAMVAGLGRGSKPVFVVQLEALDKVAAAKAAKDPGAAAKLFAKKQQAAIGAGEAVPAKPVAFTKDGEWVDEVAVFGKAPTTMPDAAYDGAIKELDNGGGTAVVVDITQLHATQDYTGYKKAASIAEDYNAAKAQVQAVQVGGKLYIHDGHHTAAAARIAGETKIKVWVEAADSVPLAPTPVATDAGGLAHSLKVKVGIAKKKHGLEDADIYTKDGVAQLDKGRIDAVANKLGVYLTPDEVKAVRYAVPGEVGTPQLLAQLDKIEAIGKEHAKDKMTPAQAAIHKTKSEDGLLGWDFVGTQVDSTTAGALDAADYSTLPGWGAAPKGKSQSYGLIIFDDEGRVLLREPEGHFGGAKWTFAKGGGKKPGTTALAELAEETGHKGVIHDVVPGGFEGTTTKTNYFLGKSKGQDLSLMDAETANMKWMSYDEAREAILSSGGKVAKRDLAVLDAAYAKLHNTTGDFAGLVAGGKQAVADAADAAAKAAHGHKVKLGMAKQHYAKDKFGGGVVGTDWATPDKLNATGLNKVLSEKGWHIDTLPEDVTQDMFLAKDVVEQKALIAGLKKAPKGTPKVPLPQPVAKAVGHAVTAEDFLYATDPASAQVALIKAVAKGKKDTLDAFDINYEFDMWKGGKGYTTEGLSPDELADLVNTFKVQEPGLYTATTAAAPKGTRGFGVTAADFDIPGEGEDIMLSKALKKGLTNDEWNSVDVLDDFDTWLELGGVDTSAMQHPGDIADIVNKYKTASTHIYKTKPKGVGHVTAKDLADVDGEDLAKADAAWDAALMKGHTGAHTTKADVQADFVAWVEQTTAVDLANAAPRELAEALNDYKAAKPGMFKPAPGTPAPPAAVPTPTPPPSAVAATPAAATGIQNTPLPNIGSLTKTKDLPGSTKPWQGVDKDGKLWVVKDVQGSGINPAHLRSEAQADEIYRRLGIPTNRGGTIDTPGGPAKVTEWFEGQTLQHWLPGKSDAEVQAVFDQLKGGFVADALLANRDVFGMHMDNIFITRSGKALRIDNGGAMTFKAMGEAKPQWGKKVVELEGLRDRSKNAHGARVFAGLADEDIHEQIRHIVKNRDAVLAAVDDEAVRKVLGERIDYLEEMLPAVPKARRTPKPKGARRVEYGVTKDLPERAKRSTSNGTTMAGDADLVEDNNILIWEELDESGAPVTRVQLKTTKRGSDKVGAALGDEYTKAQKSAGVQPVTNIHPDDNYWGKVEAAAKNIGYHAADGKYNAMTLQAMADAKADIAAKLAGATGDKAKMLEHYKDSIERLEAAKAGGIALPKGAITSYHHTPPAGVAAPVRRSNLRVEKDSGINFRIATFEKGVAKKQVGRKNTFTSEAYTIETDDGVRAKFLPRTDTYSRTNGLAMQGTINVTVEGAVTEASIKRALRLVDDLGVDTSPPNLAYEEMVYLHRGVYQHNKHMDTAYRRIWESSKTPEEKVPLLKDWVKTNMGVDVTKVKHYDPHGFGRHADGSGYRSWNRWDIGIEDIKKDMKGYSVHHTTGSLSDSRDGKLETTLRGVLQSGGDFTSTTGRVRKGVDVGATGGDTPGSDMATGGASYFFTRIKKNETPNAFFFKPKVLLRQDMVSYHGDKFGGISSLSQRKASIKGLKENAMGSRNEANFKEGLTLDELEFIKCRPHERDGIIRAFKDNGYTHLPDGRKVEDIVVTRRPPESKRVYE